MLIGEYTVTIARPIDVVFDHLVDGARNASWRGPVLSVTLLSGDGGLGSVWHQQVRGAAGRIQDADYRVTAWQRPNRYSVEATSGPTRGVAAYTLVEAGPASTVLSLELRLRPRGLVASLSGIAQRQVSRELDSLDRLKTVIESPSPTG